MESSARQSIQKWLELQCTMVRNVHRGAVLVGDGRNGAADPIALWPPRSLPSAAMTYAARLALRERRQVIEAASGAAPAAGADNQAGDIIALPLVIGGRTIGVVVLAMSAASKSRQEAALQVMGRGIGWLETIIEQRNATSNRRLAMAIEIIAEAVRHDSFTAASGAVAAAFARLFGCVRVSIGWREDDDIKVEVISNTARFERRTDLLRSVAAVMGEAFAQERRVCLPQSEELSTLSMRAHRRHQEEFGTCEIHTLPFSDDSRMVGVIMLERIGEQAFTDKDIDLVDTVVSIVGSLLAAKRDAERRKSKRCAPDLAHLLQHFAPSGYRRFGLGVIAFASIGFALGAFKMDLDVYADAVLQGPDQHAEASFDAAPPHGYRIVLAVASSDLDYLRPRMRGQVVLVQRPHTVYPFTIERLVPTTAARHVYTVEARVDFDDSDLQPGMVGIGTIDAGAQSLLRVSAHYLAGHLHRLRQWWGQITPVAFRAAATAPRMMAAARPAGR